MWQLVPGCFKFITPLYHHHNTLMISCLISFASKYSGRPKLPLAWPVMIEADRLKVKLSREASLKIKRRYELFLNCK